VNTTDGRPRGAAPTVSIRGGAQDFFNNPEEGGRGGAFQAEEGRVKHIPSRTRCFYFPGYPKGLHRRIAWQWKYAALGRTWHVAQKEP